MFHDRHLAIANLKITCETMIKTFAKNLLAKCGYKLMPLEWKPPESPSIVLHQYLRPDGGFDYAKYRAVQEQGNIRKLDLVWAVEENIRFLSDFLRTELRKPEFGICHGTRRGKEQEWFRKYLGINVIGTEISSTATQFPHTIQWDFHDVKPEWNKSVDFIYSNSLDHSYDPEKCLNAWMQCLKPKGVCILEHSVNSSPLFADELDPFGAFLEVMPYLVLKWGKGRYFAQAVLSAPERPYEHAEISYLVVRNAD